MLLIGILRERFAMWEFVDCLQIMCVDLRRRNINWMTMGVKPTNIFKGREFIAETFIDSENRFGEKASHLLFIDSDQTFAEETAAHLLSLNLPIVSGLVFQRNIPHLPCVYKRLPDSEKNLALAQEIKAWFDENDVQKIGKPTVLDMPREGSVWEVDEVGTGCLLIERSIFEQIPQPWFQGMGEVGTDISFCRRVRAHGIPIHIDLRVQLGHLVTYPVTQINFRATDQWVPIEESDMMKDE